MAEKNEFIKVMTPVFRVSFPNVFVAKAIKEGDEPKYSIAMLFDAEAQASPEYQEMKQAVMKAKKQKFGDGKIAGLRSPFRDGAEKKQFEGYEEGITFVSANSKQKPGIVDGSRVDIINPEEFYAGCYARCTLLAYGYDRMGNKGVTFLLSNIQKVRDGEQISGKSKASDDFDAIAQDDTSFSLDEDSGDFEL